MKVHTKLVKWHSTKAPSRRQLQGFTVPYKKAKVLWARQEHGTRPVKDSRALCLCKCCHAEATQMKKHIPLGKKRAYRIEQSWNRILYAVIQTFSSGFPWKQLHWRWERTAGREGEGRNCGWQHIPEEKKTGNWILNVPARVQTNLASHERSQRASEARKPRVIVALAVTLAS